MSDIINDGHNLQFKVETYNGISIIRETTTNYVNASRMCADNNKRWRQFKNSKYWKDTLEAFNLVIKPKLSNAVYFQTPSFLAPKQVKPEYQGEYIHPKLIHFVAEYCSKIYAFKVAELMDSINNQVHERLEALQLTETPQNAKTVFNLVVDEHINRCVSEQENKQCWGIRETDKFDYLESWDKDFIFNQFDRFKQSLKTINITLEELKRDYPQLLD